jgi:hypothetical protein
MASELAWKKSEEAVGSPNYELRGSDNHIGGVRNGPAFLCQNFRFLLSIYSRESFLKVQDVWCTC